MPHHVRLVNMIPRSRSGETNQDSEPSITVDRENPDVIVATAFTPDPGGGPDAPFYVSTDRGDTWALNSALPGDGPFGTSDITVSFDGSGKELFAGYLRGDTVALNVDSTATPTAGVLGNLEGRSNVDQPFTEATTVAHGPDAGRDRLYVGNNDFSSPGGRTSTIDLSLDAAAASPAFRSIRIESRGTSGQDGPQVRPAIHRDGTVYAAFYGWRSSSSFITTDVVVVRDDDWGKGVNPFTSLVDPGDGRSGFRVAQGVPIRFNDFIGQQRQAGNLAIAVDPTDSARVYLAWCDGLVAGSSYRMHVRRSDDRGDSWSATDLLTLADATNVGLAVNRQGHVALLYQQVTGTVPGQRWETHVRHSLDHGRHWHDLVLATVPAATPAKTFDPYLGDYAMLVARDEDFYGVFCANNTPDMANFPHGVRYQRNADFTTKQLLAVNNVTPVAASIDPFFFHIRHREEGRREQEEFEDGGERLVVRGLRYERLEIDEIRVERGGGVRHERRGEHPDPRHHVHGHDRHHLHEGLVRRLAAHLEEFGGELGEDI